MAKTFGLNYRPLGKLGPLDASAYDLVTFNDYGDPSAPWFVHSSALTADAIRDASLEGGGKFFAPATMSYFRSRLISGAFPLADGSAVLFVTSETDCHRERRLYTIRKFAIPGGDISMVGDAGEYATRGVALRAAKRIAAEMSTQEGER